MKLPVEVARGTLPIDLGISSTFWNWLDIDGCIRAIKSSVSLIRILPGGHGKTANRPRLRRTHKQAASALSVIGFCFAMNARERRGKSVIDRQAPPAPVAVIKRGG